MALQLLDFLPIEMVYLSLVLLIILFFEIGFQIGRTARSDNDAEAAGALGPIVGGVLAMLAFLLAFVFSMAANQHSVRKENVLQEANAIGTTYLRTDLIDARYGDPMKTLLREYVDLRVNHLQDYSVEELIKASAELQTELWNLMAAADIANPGPNSMMLTNALNDMIDMQEVRIAGVLYDRIPESIRLTLLLIAALSMITLGAQAGTSGARRLIAVIPMALAFGALTTIVLDLDRPGEGFIHVEQYAMQRLLESMQITP